ncbi:MAG: TetR/AcrR family transcriptional regulator [Anaerolineae bacterium]
MSKRQRNADTTREAILDAAEAIFAREGFAGARVDNIAELSTYNKSLIFQYFGDKTGLYVAVIRRLRVRSSQHLLAVLAEFCNVTMDKQTVRHLLETLIGASFDYLAANPNQRAMTAWDIAEGWRSLGDITPTPEEDELNALLGTLLTRARASGALHPALNATAIVLHALGLCVNYLATLPRSQRLNPQEPLDTPEKLADARQQIITLLLDGALVK